ncbi:MAG TPA: hypothetical protein PLV25_05595, partial [Opitutales bacterium]|nr:hypothetical protein [Opitutales bacterium]
MPRSKPQRPSKIQVQVHAGPCKPLAKEGIKAQKFIGKKPVEWHFAVWAPTRVEQWSELARSKQASGDFLSAARVFIVGAYTLWPRAELRHMALALKALGLARTDWAVMTSAFEALKQLYFGKAQPPSPDAHLMLEHALMVLQDLLDLTHYLTK